MGWTVKRGSKFQARWRDKDGRTRSAGTFPRAREALKAAEEAEQRDRVGLPAPLLWGEWEPTWNRHRRVEAGTRRADEPRLRAHLRPKWKDFELGEITADEVQKWITELSAPKDEGGKGLAAGTVTKLLMLLSGSLKAAIRAGHIESNPVSRVDKPKAGPTPDRFLSPEECDGVRAYLGGPHQFLFDLLLATGMRFGEALALHWEDVDFDARQITVRWSFDRNERNFKPPKSHQQRTIPISVGMAESLAERLKSQGWGEPPDIIYRGSRKPHSGLVWGSLDDAGWRYAWKAAVRVATVGEGSLRRKVGSVRTNDLRHTFASRLVQQGVPIQVVQELLGHANVATTMRYARLAPDKFDQVRQYL